MFGDFLTCATKMEEVSEQCNSYLLMRSRGYHGTKVMVHSQVQTLHLRNNLRCFSFTDVSYVSSFFSFRRIKANTTASFLWIRS